MYAVIETGGKQHKVEKGMVLSVDLLKDDVGKKITFENVLLYVDGDKVEVGQPYLDNVKVTAEVKNVVNLKKFQYLDLDAESIVCEKLDTEQSILK